MMDDLGVARARLVATSAARDAANGHVFLRAAGRGRRGSPPSCSPGREEGALSMAGAVADLPASDGPFLVLDIGGGSTELVAGDGPDDPDLAAVSLQVGCVRLSERFLGHDPPLEAELDAAASMVGDALDRAVADHPRFLDKPRLVGLAGTVTTLSSLQQGLTTYDRDRIHHAALTLDRVDHWLRLLAGEDRAGRLARPGMVEGREDVIVGGALILSVVMHRLGLRDCLVSEADILDGLVDSLLRPSGR